MMAPSMMARLAVATLYGAGRWAVGKVFDVVYGVEEPQTYVSTTVPLHSMSNAEIDLKMAGSSGIEPDPSG